MSAHRLGHWLENLWDYACFVALATGAGVVFGHAFGVWVGVAVGTGFLLACGGVHWGTHRAVRAARVSKVSQRRISGRAQ